MKQNPIDIAVGALKMVPVYFTQPGTVTRDTLIGITADALAAIGTIPPLDLALAEVFRAVDAVTGHDQVAYVTPTNNPGLPFGAVVADKDGQILAAATGVSKEGLAELIRIKLLPAAGRGEVST